MQPECSRSLFLTPMDAKFQSELPGGLPTPHSRRVKIWPVVLAGAALALIHLAYTSYLSGNSTEISDNVLCPQASPLTPRKNESLWAELTNLHATDEFAARAIAQLSAAVQIPTETFDAMGPVGEDERWASRGLFVEHLVQAFPLIHATLELKKVNTYGLLYTWKGADLSLKALLMMGHYDVVPVAPLSADQWTHPAYSGYFDGESIWGRGSLDDKSGVISILTSIEVLLEKGFTPTRSVVLSFGFDEEGGGYQGAGELGKVLLDRFGPDSFAMIVDEGSGFSEQYGAAFAVPGVAEKGSVNVNIEVQTPGGHSSVPPEHTSIGILAALIVHLENNAPKAALEVGTPAFEMAQCFGAHGPAIAPKLRSAILRAVKSKKALRTAESMLLQDKMFKALVGTTLAVDIINGGVKSNALPEQASAVVNHRIATQSSVNATISRDAFVVKDLASKFNLSMTAYGEEMTSASISAGSLILTAPLRVSLEPAPITPTGADAAPYQILAGTIRSTYNTRRALKGAKDDLPLFVTPGLMSGNTDTRFNWALSEHIFRYGHRNLLRGGLGNIHTVNEHISADSFTEMITFFTTLILNMDEASL
ncbi:carboxypeptidase S [Mycena sp. CBHHK59/15]|nr:carboxypeptidase S [Mycena sp. CBHHK59/15]